MMDRIWLHWMFSGWVFISDNHTDNVCSHFCSMIRATNDTVLWKHKIRSQYSNECFSFAHLVWEMTCPLVKLLYFQFQLSNLHKDNQNRCCLRIFSRHHSMKWLNIDSYSHRLLCIRIVNHIVYRQWFHVSLHPLLIWSVIHSCQLHFNKPVVSNVRCGSNWTFWAPIGSRISLAKPT